MTDIGFRGLEVGDAGWLVMQHGLLYARDEGFDSTFEALVAEILADFIRNHDPTCERAFILHRGAERLGSIFCVRQDDVTAKLRMFLLLPEVRGQGVGKRMLAECLAYARSCGYRRMELWTHKSHRAACALYAATGWTLMERRPVVNFGVALEEMRWVVNL